MQQIQKIAVIGSGVMGSGIAAQVANAGIPVILMDIVPKDETLPRSHFAQSAIERMLKTDPAPLMHPKNAALITPANLQDDLALLSDCDWIIEVVLEDIAVKHDLYTKINQYRKAGSIISSNTSTIPLDKLTQPFDNTFKSDFLITHFFNPPRYMRLLELVVSPHTRLCAKSLIKEFCDVKLGKGVVECHDTAGFIANRLGVFWLQVAMNEAVQQGIDIELADAVMGKPLGIPKTGVFGLIDLVGIDLMPHLAKSLLDYLPEQDLYRTAYVDYPFIHQMIAAKYTGRKGKGGFYRLDDKRNKQALSLDKDHFDETTSYHPATKIKSDAVDAGKKGIKAVIHTDDAGGRYARAVLRQVLYYAASLVPEIAGSIYDVDQAMKWGYNWTYGPFEMIDAIGVDDFIAELKAHDLPIPLLLQQVAGQSFYKDAHYFGVDGQYHAINRGDGVLLLADIKRTATPVLKSASASVWDIGDGVLCLEFTGKMNTLDETVFQIMHQVIALIGDGSGAHKALVIYNEGSAFSAGANLGLALFAANIALWPQIESLVEGGQNAYMALKYAPFPVVSAPANLALGGGCEILLHSDHIQAHAETYTGLVEVGVGVVPGWGGCKEMILRFQALERAQKAKLGNSNLSPMEATKKAFEVIATATTAKSAQDAKEIGYFRATDGVTMNRDRLLYDAKQQALRLSENYTPPIPVTDIRLSGKSGLLALTMAVNELHKSGKATDYDVVVSTALVRILSGGDKADINTPLTEQDILKLERTEFMNLVKQSGTLARIQHMLDTGKPLRN